MCVGKAEPKEVHSLSQYCNIREQKGVEGRFCPPPHPPLKEKLSEHVMLLAFGLISFQNPGNVAYFCSERVKTEGIKEMESQNLEQKKNWCFQESIIFFCLNACSSDALKIWFSPTCK